MREGKTSHDRKTVQEIKKAMRRVVVSKEELNIIVIRSLASII